MFVAGRRFDPLADSDGTRHPAGGVCVFRLEVGSRAVTAEVRRCGTRIEQLSVTCWKRHADPSDIFCSELRHSQRADVN